MTTFQMAINPIASILLIALFGITFNSCNSSDSKSPVSDSKIKFLTTSQQNWVQIGSRCNKIIFRRYYLNLDSNTIRSEKNETWSDSTINTKAIANFSSLFTKVENGGYCCCPFSLFSVTFYNDTTELGKYFVDTSRVGKALFFDGSYQTSYSIDNRDWLEYLTKMTNYR